MSLVKSLISKNLHLLCTLLFGVAVVLFFALGYPHHLHYQEQFQLFLFDSTYVWEIVRVPGGVADLLGRSFVPAFLLWLFLLDENALMGGVWAVLLSLLAAWGILSLRKKLSTISYSLFTIVAILLLYLLVGPVCLPIPIESLWTGAHYHRYPTVFPWLLWGAAFSIWGLMGIALLIHRFPKHFSLHSPLSSHLLTALVAAIMGSLVWKNANFRAEKVMQYDFMARHQQWNRILETANREKPNNQIGVTVQNLALAMHGVLLDQLFNYHQNGIAGLLPDVKEDATSPLPTAEAFYQLGMINVAQRTVFEAQEAILDFQKSGRCYMRLAQTNLINGQYEVARKYLSALQKTLFYHDWANETLPLLGDEAAIAKHPEYGRLRKMAYDDDFYFSDHVTPEMLQSLYLRNRDNGLAYQYLVAYYLLTGDQEGYNNFISSIKQ